MRLCSVLPFGAMKTDNSISGGNAETVASVNATPAHIAGQDPEFLDARGVEGRFSIRRSLLYELHNGGHVKSVSLRRRGQSRGKRLFSVDSIRQFLAKQMDAAK